MKTARRRQPGIAVPVEVVITDPDGHLHKHFVHLPPVLSEGDELRIVIDLEHNSMPLIRVK